MTTKVTINGFSRTSRTIAPDLTQALDLARKCASAQAMIVSDTIVPDTIVSDTIVSDTIVSDTTVSDTIVSDTIVSDTTVPAPDLLNDDQIGAIYHLTDNVSTIRVNSVVMIETYHNQGMAPLGPNRSSAPQSSQPRILSESERERLSLENWRNVISVRTGHAYSKYGSNRRLNARFKALKNGSKASKNGGKASKNGGKASKNGGKASKNGSKASKNGGKASKNGSKASKKQRLN
jgi:hypothetical protein